MDAKEVLVKAKELIATPDKWTKGTWARDEQGCNVALSGDMHRAACFCVRGAVAVASGAERFIVCDDALSPRGKADEALSVAAKGRSYAGSVDFNDHYNTKHEDVLGLIDEAIASLENA